MEKLDRLVWVAGASFTAFGIRVGVRANSEAALRAVMASLTPGLERGDGTEVDLLYSVVSAEPQTRAGFRKYNLAYANSDELMRSPDFDSIPPAVERHLSIYVGEYAHGRVFIHAGVVGWKDRGILIPGPTRAGKSTLVAAMLRVGATYYSDDFAVVDPDGRIHPYLSPLHHRNGDGTVHSTPAAELQAPVGEKPLPVGLVLVTHYKKGGRWRPRRVSPGEGLLAVLRNTLPAQREPARVLRTLTTMLTGVPVLRGQRGGADATVARLVRDGHLER